ncbi:PaaI family thioesterase [Parvularcula sp. IMCC14364]|uniref:PaaI family thioesterase n=1 Tax=Parvularcula sp. IMCC14364 TaxID=3067902 RepID=UPI0027418F4E|nr:DUF4442 domain-containing protein [Parvularcula sp. IMCC14364]
MNMRDAMKIQLIEMVPFAKSIGVVLTDMGDGTAEGTLELRPDLMNHIQTMHAGVMYSLGETVSGAAMTGAFADQILGLTPVAAEASIQYTKKAKGGLRATGKTDQSGETLRALVEKDGKARFRVTVTFFDETDAEVGNMNVEWAIRKNG